MTARDDIDYLHRRTIAQLDELKRIAAEDRDSLAEDEPVPASIVEEEARVGATELAALWAVVKLLADRIDATEAS